MVSIQGRCDPITSTWNDVNVRSLSASFNITLFFSGIGAVRSALKVVLPNELYTFVHFFPVPFDLERAFVLQLVKVPIHKRDQPMHRKLRLQRFRNVASRYRRCGAGSVLLKGSMNGFEVLEDVEGAVYHLVHAGPPVWDTCH